MPGDAELKAFSLRRVPEVHFGPGRVRAIGDDAAAVGDPGRAVVLVVDPVLVELGVAGRAACSLEEAGADVAIFADVAGEPKQEQVEAATGFVRAQDAGLVIALGGGSVMDIAKVAATVARTGESPIAFAMEGKPLPGIRYPRSAFRPPPAPARSCPRPTSSPTPPAARSGSGVPRPSRRG